MNSQNDLNIIWFFRVIYRRIRLIASLVLLVLVVSIIVMLILPPAYRATTTLLIEPSEKEKTSEINVLLAGERLALTYSQIINSKPILEKVISQLNLNITTGEFTDKVAVQPIRDTQLIRISVTDPSPKQAVLLANTISTAFITYVEDLSVQQYNQALADLQNNIEQKKKDIALIQSKIDAQNSLKVNYETELTRLDLLLTENRTDYRTQQQNAQTLQLTVAQLADKIHVVEPAQLSKINQAPPFIATLTMLFNQEIITGGGGFSNPQSNLISQANGPMLVREPVLEEVIKNIGINETAQSLQKRVWVVPVPNTQLLELYVKDEKSSQTVLIADTLAKVFIDRALNMMAEPYNNRLAILENDMKTLTSQLEVLQNEIKDYSKLKNQVDLELKSLESDLSTKNSDLRDLQNNYDQSLFEAKRSASTVVVAEPATLPDSPAQNRILYVALAVLVTLFISLGLVFFLEYLEDKVVSQDDISALLDQEPIGVIGHINKGENELVLGPNTTPHIVEDFRELSIAIQSSIKNIPLHRLLVTSPNPEEGKSIVAANLGWLLAKTGTQVIVVDADFRLPRLHQLFSVDQSKGLVDALETKFTDNLLKPTPIKNLKVLTSGDIPADPVETLSSPYLEDVLLQLSKNAEIVLFDCPPLLTLADASYLSPLVDGAILVIRSGHTERKAAKKSMSILKKAGIQYIGIVLNDVSGYPNGYYRHYHMKNTNPTISNGILSPISAALNRFTRWFPETYKAVKDRLNRPSKSS